MIAGEALGAFCLTEPSGGSDAAALRTPRRARRAGRRADRVPADRHEDLDLERARTRIATSCSRRSTPTKGPKGITAFLVEKGTPGFRFGAHEKKMGIRACPAAELIFDGAVVPAENRSARRVGDTEIALSSLGRGPDLDRRGVRRHRPVGARAVRRVPPAAQGVRGATLRAAGPAVHARRDGARRRRGTGWSTEAARAKDRGEPIGEASSLAKWTASDTAMKVATDAVQLLRGAATPARPASSA